MLVSGCGGRSPSTSAGQSNLAHAGKQLLAFAACMRSQGVPAFPDPQVSSSQIRISPGTVDPTSPAFKSAQKACHRLLSSGVVQGAAAGSAREKTQGLTFAACVRSHGVPNFPDPDPDPDGAFNLPSAINQQAPQFKRAIQACASVQPNSLLINQNPQ
jgi:hypothetical protein